MIAGLFSHHDRWSVKVAVWNLRKYAAVSQSQIIDPYDPRFWIHHSQWMLSSVFKLLEYVLLLTPRLAAYMLKEALHPVVLIVMKVVLKRHVKCLVTDTPRQRPRKCTQIGRCRVRVREYG